MSFFTNLSPQKLQLSIQSEIESGGKFELLRSPYQALDNLHLVQFHKECEGIGAVYGLGKSKKMHEAKIRAYFEYLERKAFLTSDDHPELKSSNGISAHKFKLLAKKSAKDELFERDSVLIHWYTKTPFTEHRMIHDFEGLKQELNTNGYDCRIGTTHLGFQETAVAFIINNKTGGFCIGSSSGKRRQKDFAKAILEAVINLAFGNYGKNTDALLNQLIQNGFNNLEMHRTHWLYKEAAPDWIFEPKESKIRRAIKHLEPKLNFVSIAELPYPVVAALSSSVFKLKAGRPGKEETDLLTQRIDSQYSHDALLPHPLF